MGSMDRDNRIKWQKSGYDDDDNDNYGDEKAQQRVAEFLKRNQKMASRSQWGKKKASPAQRAKRKLPLGRCRGTIKSYSVWQDLGKIVDAYGQTYFFHQNSLADVFLPQPREEISFTVRLVRDQVVYAGNIRRINWHSNVKDRTQVPTCPFCGSNHGIRFQYIPELENPEPSALANQENEVPYAQIGSPEMAAYCHQMEQEPPVESEELGEEDRVWVCATCLREVPRTPENEIGARADLKACRQALEIVHHHGPLMRVAPYAEVMVLILLLTWVASTKSFPAWGVAVYLVVAILGLMVLAHYLKRKTAQKAPILRQDSPFLYLLSGTDASKHSSVYQERAEALLNNTASNIKLLAQIKE